MPDAIWNNRVIVEAPADEIQQVEENVYFPLSSVKRVYFQPSETHTTCRWKGIASYHDVAVDGKRTITPPGITAALPPRRQTSRITSPSGMV